VERGDYQIIRGEDSQTIDPLEFAGTVEPGMIVEMSIVLREKTALKNKMGKCPRCQHTNSTVTAAHGWIEWKVLLNLLHALIINLMDCSRQCSGQFQITGAALDQNEDRGDKESDTWDWAERKGERSGENLVEDTPEGVEEIISPSSYVSLFCYRAIIDNEWLSRLGGGFTKETSDNEKGRKRDECGTQFFRRIRLICQGDANRCVKILFANIAVVAKPTDKLSGNQHL
jgi:hypothetical protein